MADDVPDKKPCQCGCSGWYCWLQSLATPGGNLFVLFVLLAVFVPAMIYLMVWYGPGSPVVITLVTITSGFAAAMTTRMGTDPSKAVHAQTGAAGASADSK